MTSFGGPYGLSKEEVLARKRVEEDLDYRKALAARDKLRSTLSDWQLALGIKKEDIHWCTEARFLEARVYVPKEVMLKMDPSGPASEWAKRFLEAKAVDTYILIEAAIDIGVAEAWKSKRTRNPALIGACMQTHRGEEGVSRLMIEKTELLALLEAHFSSKELEKIVGAKGQDKDGASSQGQSTAPVIQGIGKKLKNTTRQDIGPEKNGGPEMSGSEGSSKPNRTKSL